MEMFEKAFGGSIRRNCMTVMTPMQRCSVTKPSGKAKRVLPLLCLLSCMMFLPCRALALQPLEDGSGRVVDLDTGDLYSWDDSQGIYVKDEPEKEVETKYVGIEVDSEQSDVPVPDFTLEDIASLIEPLSNYDQSAQYQVGTSNVSIFSGLVSKVPWGQHYVYWRDGQYSYRFAYGDLELTGTTFKGNGSVTIVTYSTTGGSGSYYTWTSSKDSAFVLSANNRLVYSDLGDYPGLSDREVMRYVQTTALVVSGIAIFFLFDRLRRACFRR